MVSSRVYDAVLRGNEKMTLWLSSGSEKGKWYETEWHTIHPEKLHLMGRTDCKCCGKKGWLTSEPASSCSHCKKKRNVRLDQF